MPLLWFQGAGLWSRKKSRNILRPKARFVDRLASLTGSLRLRV